MADPYKKPSPGEPLEIPARTYGEMIDVVLAARNQKHDLLVPPGRSAIEPDIILVQNNTGDDVPQFGILGLDVPLILPADNLTEFQNQPALMGVTPYFPDHLGKFCVSLGPLANGAIGPAVISGVVPVKLNVIRENQSFAEIGATTATLNSGWHGSAKILWKESGTGEKWGLVRLANGMRFGGVIASRGGFPITSSLATIDFGSAWGWAITPGADDIWQVNRTDNYITIQTGALVFATLALDFTATSAAVDFSYDPVSYSSSTGNSAVDAALNDIVSSANSALHFLAVQVPTYVGIEGKVMQNGGDFLVAQAFGPSSNLRSTSRYGIPAKLYGSAITWAKPGDTFTPKVIQLGDVIEANCIGAAFSIHVIAGVAPDIT